MEGRRSRAEGRVGFQGREARDAGGAGQVRGARAAGVIAECNGALTNY